MGFKLPKFGSKYQFFLSDASNDEIVSISKELSDEIVLQASSMTRSSIAAMALDAAILFCILIMMLLGLGYQTQYDSIFIFVRIGVLAVLCIALFMSSSAFSKGIRVQSVSTIMWRTIREAPNDEAAYEQIAAINRANKMMFTGRNDLSTSNMLVILSVVITVIIYIIGFLTHEGYL